MGERAIKSHAKGKKHCDRLAPYIQSSCINFMPVSKGSAESPGGSSTSTCSSTLDKFVVLEAATNAEIRWCLKILMSSYSFRSCDGLADLFRSMFPDSTITEKFFLEKDKCAYFINYVIAPHFHSILINIVKDSEFYAISFNESLNTVIQMGHMDLAVNFWDNVVNKVCTCYLNLTFLSHTRLQDLFEHSISALDSLDLKKLLQVSVDGPSANWAYFSELCNYQIENDMSKLLSTRSCGLLAIHGAFKTGDQSIDWKKVLRTLHQILHDSPARRNDYADVTRSS